MRADALLEWEIRPEPYGNTLKTARERLKANVPRTLARYWPAISFVARKFGPKRVKDLEKVSTALYIPAPVRRCGQAGAGPNRCTGNFRPGKRRAAGCMVSVSVRASRPGA